MSSYAKNAQRRTQWSVYFTQWRVLEAHFCCGIHFGTDTETSTLKLWIQIPSELSIHPWLMLFHPDESELKSEMVTEQLDDCENSSCQRLSKRNFSTIQWDARFSIIFPQNSCWKLEHNCLWSNNIMHYIFMSLYSVWHEQDNIILLPPSCWLDRWFFFLLLVQHLLSPYTLRYRLLTQFYNIHVSQLCVFPTEICYFFY